MIKIVGLSVRNKLPTPANMPGEIYENNGGAEASRLTNIVGKLSSNSGWSSLDSFRTKIKAFGK